MKNFQATIASECRWADVFERLIGDWFVLWEESAVDYQGHASLLSYKDGRFCYVAWTYGSCSGCDPWEDMPYDDVLTEAKRDAMFFDDIHMLWNWIGMLLKSHDAKALQFMEALVTFATMQNNAT